MSSCSRGEMYAISLDVVHTYLQDHFAWASIITSDVYNFPESTHCVVIGRVTEGMDVVERVVHQAPNDYGVFGTITNCGEL